MYCCTVCRKAMYDPDEGRLCDSCKDQAITEFIKRHTNKNKQKNPAWMKGKKETQEELLSRQGRWEDLNDMIGTDPF